MKGLRFAVEDEDEVDEEEVEEEEAEVRFDCFEEGGGGSCCRRGPAAAGRGAAAAEADTEASALGVAAPEGARRGRSAAARGPERGGMLSIAVDEMKNR